MDLRGGTRRRRARDDAAATPARQRRFSREHGVWHDGSGESRSNHEAIAGVALRSVTACECATLERIGREPATPRTSPPSPVTPTKQRAAADQLDAVLASR
jgi:hypothetical protein